MSNKETATTSGGSNVLSIQDVEKMLILMRGYDVIEFEALGLKVRFGSLNMPKAESFDPDVEKAKELEDIKLRLERMNQEADEIENWST